MNITAHEALLLSQIFDDREKLSNEEYINKLVKRVEVLTGLVNSLHVDKIQMPAWKTFSETILIKICFHISSLFQLFHGTELPFKHTKNKYLIFDEPSIYSLFRTITENYLTFFYLFIDDISEEEKHFRFLIYEYCGIYQRQSFAVSLPENKQKQINDAEHLKKLKAAITANDFFKAIEPRIQKKIMDGIQPRLKTWRKLIKDARLNIGFDLNLYGFNSSYSHSEYLSLMQIRSNNYEFKPHRRKSHFVLFIIHMLISRMIINLSELFPSVKQNFDKTEKKLKEEIILLSENLAFDLADSKR